MSHARAATAASSGNHAHEEPITPARLRDVALFGALGDDVLTHLARTLRTSNLAAGEVVFHEGDPAQAMYVLLEGEAEVVKRSRSGRDHRIALLGAGDCFGEMSVVDLQPRSGTVRAVAPSRVLCMSCEDMDALYRHDVKSYALVTLNIARDLSRRLRVTDGILAEFTANVLDVYAHGRRSR